MAETYPELRAIAEDDIKHIQTEVSLLEEELTDAIDIDVFDRSVEGLIEIRPGTGGEEAGHFAKDLKGMYLTALNLMGIQTECTGLEDNDIKIRCIGKGSLKYVRFEAGVHRVQRVPITDTKGRVHTSTVSVVVLPSSERKSVSLRPSDLKIESYRSGGPGGQNANMSNSAVRVTHIPTGISVCNQEERNNSINKEKAIASLAVRLNQMAYEKTITDLSTMRHKQVKTAHRSEKIRTYNVCQNRVTDHSEIRSKNFAYETFISGKLLPQLMREKRKQYVAEWIENQGDFHK